MGVKSPRQGGGISLPRAAGVNEEEEEEEEEKTLLLLHDLLLAQVSKLACSPLHASNPPSFALTVSVKHRKA